MPKPHWPIQKGELNFNQSPRHTAWNIFFKWNWLFKTPTEVLSPHHLIKILSLSCINRMSLIPDSTIQDSELNAIPIFFFPSLWSFKREQSLFYELIAFTRRVTFPPWIWIVIKMGQSPGVIISEIGLFHIYGLLAVQPKSDVPVFDWFVWIVCSGL